VRGRSNQLHSYAQCVAGIYRARQPHASDSRAPGNWGPRLSTGRRCEVLPLHGSHSPRRRGARPTLLPQRLSGRGRPAADGVPREALSHRQAPDLVVGELGETLSPLGDLCRAPLGRVQDLLNVVVAALVDQKLLLARDALVG